MTERLLLSGRQHALCAVDATRRALEERHRIDSAAALLETIVENVAETMDRIADRIVAGNRGTGAVGRDRFAPGSRPVARALRGRGLPSVCRNAPEVCRKTFSFRRWSAGQQRSGWVFSCGPTHQV
jgi:hypothetical protein